MIDGVGTVKVCDLGFAQSLATMNNDEEKRAEAIGSDLYSIGVLLYALLTGFDPYAGVTPNERVSDKLESGLPIPNLMAVEAPPSVVRLLKRLMHPDRTKRISKAEDAVAGIEQLLAEVRRPTS